MAFWIAKFVWQEPLFLANLNLQLGTSFRPVVAQRHKVWLWSRLVVGSMPTRRNEIFTYIYISMSSLWCRGQAQRWVLPLNTQSLQSSAESEERSVLTLGSLCLLCSVQDTAWSKKKVVDRICQIRQKESDIKTLRWILFQRNRDIACYGCGIQAYFILSKPGNENNSSEIESR